MTPQDEIIDLRKLTQRELLIRTHDKLETLDKKLDKNIESTSRRISSVKDAQANAHIAFVKLETRVKTQSSVFGAISGLVTGLVAILIKIFIK